MKEQTTEVSFAEMSAQLAAENPELAGEGQEAVGETAPEAVVEQIAEFTPIPEDVRSPETIQQEAVQAQEIQQAIHETLAVKESVKVEAPMVADEKKEILGGTDEVALSPEEIREFEQHRHDSEEQSNARADMRNEKRGLFAKIFKRNKTEGLDIAHEEALRVDALMEKRQTQTQESSTEAARSVLESSEFQNKRESQIENEELARKLAPKVVEAFERGDFALAYKEEQKWKYTGSEEAGKALRGIEALFTQKAESAIVSGDKQAMRGIVETPRAYKTIGLEMLAKMPKEIIQNETLQKELEGSLSGLIVNARDPEASVRLANELINKGLIDVEKVHEVYKSKGVQNELSSSISGYILNAGNPEKAIKNAQDFMRMGIMNQESVSAILQSPDIQNNVERHIEGWVRNARDSQRAVKELGRYQSLGIVTKEKAEEIKRKYIK